MVLVYKVRIRSCRFYTISSNIDPNSIVTLPLQGHLRKDPQFNGNSHIVLIRISPSIDPNNIVKLHRIGCYQHSGILGGRRSKKEGYLGQLGEPRVPKPTEGRSLGGE